MFCFQSIFLFLQYVHIYIYHYCLARGGKIKLFFCTYYVFLFESSPINLRYKKPVMRCSMKSKPYYSNGNNALRIYRLMRWNVWFLKWFPQA